MMDKFPTDLKYFDKFKTPSSSMDYMLNFSGLRIKLTGVEEHWSSQIEQRFSCFLEKDLSSKSDLSVQILKANTKYYIQPDFSKKTELYKLSTSFKKEIFFMSSFSFAGWLDLSNFNGQIAFATSKKEPRDRSIENYLRAAIAWLCISKGGFFMHSASILRKNSVYLFFGPSTAGKSTLAASNQEGEVISDDLTIVLPSGSGFNVLGSSFRGTYRGGEPVVGSFPLHSLYRIVKDEKCFIEKKPTSHLMAAFIGSLPFINDHLNQRPGLMSQLILKASNLPIYILHLYKGANFWKLIDNLTL